MIKGQGYILKHRSELSPARIAELDAKHKALLARPRKPTTRWLVFGRPVGARCWSLTSREFRLGRRTLEMPAVFGERPLALEHAAWVRKTKRCYWGGVPDARACQACVVKVVLPK
jgi:hypothetical protein